jgi:hypothetical protein
VHGHLGFNIICIVEESGRFKINIVGQEWAVSCRCGLDEFSPLRAISGRWSHMVLALVAPAQILTCLLVYCEQHE